MEITQRKTVDLIPYVNNARTHSEQQFNQFLKLTRFCCLTGFIGLVKSRLKSYSGIRDNRYSVSYKLA